MEKLNEEHWHEALDRVHDVQGIIDAVLVCNPAIEQDKHLADRVDMVQNALSELYQDIARAEDKWLKDTRMGLKNRG